jgi:hypothetical protein
MYTVKIAFVSLVSLVVLLADIQMVFPLVAVAPLDEKRLLAPLPDFVGKVLHGDARLSGAINRWFDDRVGFRPWLVRLSHQIDYSLFTYSDKVYIGRDGYTFGKDMIADQVAGNRGGSAIEQRLHQVLRDLASYLRQRGVTLVVVANPIKATVYPELLPSEAPRLPTDNQFERLRSFLRTDENWIYLDGQDMLANCPGHQLFYRLDEHMTAPAGLCLAVQVVNRIALDAGRPGPFWNPAFKFETGLTGSNMGLVAYLALLAPPSEIYEMTSQTPVVDGTFDRSSEHFFDALYPFDPSDPFEWVYTANDQVKGSKLPPLVWFGNSFTDYYLVAGLQIQFAQVYRIRSTYARLADALRALPPSAKYFLLQFIDSQLDRLSAEQIPE